MLKIFVLKFEWSLFVAVSLRAKRLLRVSLGGKRLECLRFDF